MPKKPLLLVLPHLGTLSLQTRTKLRKSQISNLKVISIVTNYRLCLRVKTNKANVFCFKDRIAKLLYGVVCKFQCELCNESCYGDVNVIIVRIGQHIRISSLTKKKVIFHHLLKVLVC